MRRTLRRSQVWVVTMMLLGGCMGQKDAISLTPVSFEQLPGFEADAHAEALAAFVKTCNGRALAPSHGFSAPLSLSPGAWRDACREAANIIPDDSAAAEQFFRTRFSPYQITGAEAHFTGYYVPVLRASRRQEGSYRYPVYALPPELKNGAATPYADRAAIDGGALAGRGLELLWCDDPVMLFFAHIQGSATVELPDGKHVRLAFAGKNGQPYHAIGKTLVERGELAREKVSLQSIRDWLYTHPGEAASVMQSNPSYIFFSLDESARDVRGSHGSALTPGRSLAVDTQYVPLGLPLFIATTSVNGAPLQRLIMAADTGSAIRGAARGDIFFGYGEEAETKAGAMNAGGEMYLLLPRGQ